MNFLIIVNIGIEIFLENLNSETHELKISYTQYQIMIYNNTFLFSSTGIVHKKCKNSKFQIQIQLFKIQIPMVDNIDY